MKNWIIATTIVLCGPSIARAADCKSIADAAARLACFDGAGKAKPAKKTATPTDEYAAAKKAMLRKLTDPESARWGDFYKVAGDGGSPLICGIVNSKNQMGGYVGNTGFTYTPSNDEAILLFSGRTDDRAGTATRLYRAYCLSDPRSDKRAIPGNYP